MTTTLVLHAAARGITIEALSTELNGDLDVRGLLGLDETVSPGYERIQIRMTVKANCPDEQLDALLAYTQQHSPVCITVCRPVPVTIERVGGSGIGLHEPDAGLPANLEKGRAGRLRRGGRHVSGPHLRRRRGQQRRVAIRAVQ